MSRQVGINGRAYDADGDEFLQRFLEAYRNASSGGNRMPCQDRRRANGHANGAAVWASEGSTAKPGRQDERRGGVLRAAAQALGDFSRGMVRVHWNAALALAWVVVEIASPAKRNVWLDVAGWTASVVITVLVLI